MVALRRALHWLWCRLFPRAVVVDGTKLVCPTCHRVISLA